MNLREEKNAGSPMSFAVKDEKTGEVLAALEVTPETVASIVYLLERAGKAQREKLASWMIEHGFSTGHGDTIDDLLKELAWQIAELRSRKAGMV